MNFNSADFIYGSSGFILPSNSYYEKFDPLKDNYIESIFNRTTEVSNKAQMLEFYGDNQVYRSETINQAIDKYMADNSSENYLALYNIALDIFKLVDAATFFKLQAGNKHLSTMSNMFCSDIITRDFDRTYSNYAVLPFNLRWSPNNGITKSDATDKMEKVSRYTSNNYINWSNILPEYADNRTTFITFFRYIFADFY